MIYPDLKLPMGSASGTQPYSIVVLAAYDLYSATVTNE